MSHAVRRRLKMTDVAALAGVSVATVSRALSQSGPVSEAARLRIAEVLHQTGYTPNSAARSLRRREARCVIVIVPDISDSFFSLLLRGIEERAIALNYSVLIGNAANDRTREAIYARHVAAGLADGLILINGRLPRVSGVRSGAAPPAVAVSEPVPGADLPLVSVDNRAAARAAVGHLLGLGHRRIGHIAGSPRNPLTRDRLAGYRMALRDGGIGAEAGLIADGDFSIASGAAAVATLWRQARPPTALFCANDDMAVGAIGALKASGLSVPDDVSVCGFDDVPLAASYAPALTTVRQPFFEMGSRAMDALLACLSGAGRPADIMLPTELVVRESTGPARP